MRPRCSLSAPEGSRSMKSRSRPFMIPRRTIRRISIRGRTRSGFTRYSVRNSSNTYSRRCLRLSWTLSCSPSFARCLREQYPKAILFRSRPSVRESFQRLTTIWSITSWYSRAVPARRRRSPNMPRWHLSRCRQAQVLSQGYVSFCRWYPRHLSSASWIRSSACLAIRSIRYLFSRQRRKLLSHQRMVLWKQ